MAQWANQLRWDSCCSRFEHITWRSQNIFWYFLSHPYIQFILMSMEAFKSKSEALLPSYCFHLSRSSMIFHRIFCVFDVFFIHIYALSKCKRCDYLTSGIFIQSVYYHLLSHSLNNDSLIKEINNDIMTSQAHVWVRWQQHMQSGNVQINWKCAKWK